jgi:diguanylate cyclase (GGDEF)-like protein
MSRPANGRKAAGLRRRALTDVCWLIGAVVATGVLAQRLDVPRRLEPVAGTAPWTVIWCALLIALPATLVFSLRRWNDIDALADYEATHRLERDPLTGLPNRARLHLEAVRALARARRSGQLVAVLFLDLDRFKGVNDTYGHETGDALLLAVAGRLAASVRETDLLTRYAGDEFVILCEQLHGEREAHVVAERLAEAFRDPFEVQGHSFSISASIGIALSVAGRDADPLELIRDADTAMYRAKAQGRGCSVAFHHAMSSERNERHSVARRLNQALERGEFHLLYQPIARMSDTAIVGAEALLRWTDPERGLVSPAEFIPTLEQTGLIVEVGAWIVDEACRQLAEWHERLGADRAPSVSVNVAVLQVTQPNFADIVTGAIARRGVNPRKITLEITEAGLMADVAASWTSLRTLKAAGVRLALDDFGTGHSSLSYIRSFALDCVKIDQSFVRELPASHEDRAIVEAIIRLAMALHVDTVAEGIETPEQASMLRDLGCPLGQGYLLGRPQPAEDLTRLLAAAAPLAQPAPTPIRML